MPIFLVIVVAILALTHVYFARRLVRAPAWPKAVRRSLYAALVVLPIVALFGLAAPRWLTPSAARPWAWAGGIWAGLTFLLLMLLLLSDAIRASRFVARRIARKPAFDPDRRRFLARFAAGGVGASAAGLGGVALASAAQGPQVVRVDVVLPRLPRALDGFRIVQLSDLHIGAIHDDRFVADVVERTNALEPDVVAITGDLADAPVGDAGDASDAVGLLRGLRARHGVFFTTGNHEYFWGVEATLARLRALGIRVLRNERVAIEKAGASLDIAGVDDASAVRFGDGHGADVDAAMRGRDPSRPVVLLAHQPRQVFDAQRHDVDLVLSGHTHGGQIFPFGLFVRLVQPAVRGLHDFGATRLYVSCGTGTWGPPMRLFARGEIALITLRAVGGDARR